MQRGCDTLQFMLFLFLYLMFQHMLHLSVKLLLYLLKESPLFIQGRKSDEVTDESEVRNLCHFAISLSIHKYKEWKKVYVEINEGKLAPKHVTTLHQYDGLKNVLTAYCVDDGQPYFCHVWVILKSNKAWYLWTTTQCSLDQPSLIPQGSLSDFERCQPLMNLTLLSGSINITAEFGHITVHFCFWEPQVG